jgi:hypothetical protein
MESAAGSEGSPRIRHIDLQHACRPIGRLISPERLAVPAAAQEALVEFDDTAEQLSFGPTMAPRSLCSHADAAS